MTSGQATRIQHPRRHARNWVARGGIGLCAMLASMFMLVLGQRTHLSLLGLSYGLFSITAVCILVAHKIAPAYRPGDYPAADLPLLARYRQSAFRQSLMVTGVVMLYPLGSLVAQREFHASFGESLLIGLLPCILVAALLTQVFPARAGSVAETLRAKLLTLDRNRKQQAFVYIYSMFQLALNILSWRGQIRHVLAGGAIDTRRFATFGVTSIIWILILVAPWNWIRLRSERHIVEDESVAHHRQVAYRNGFFVLALGVLGVWGMVDDPRLLSVALPIVFDAALMTALGTLAFMEWRAGVFSNLPDEAAL